ncbi:MAG TPA: hypothetical protein VFY82_03390 [Acidimicrobiales bacterium]|nr:hypothetical protein [Acidimicrobiales bacterium]
MSVNSASRRRAERSPADGFLPRSRQAPDLTLDGLAGLVAAPAG